MHLHRPLLEITSITAPAHIWREGETFTATVVSTDGNTVVLAGNGFLFRATTTVPLSAGAEIFLRFRGRSGERIVFQLVEKKNPGKPQRAGIQPGPEEADFPSFSLAGRTTEEKAAPPPTTAACFFLLPTGDKYIPVHLQVEYEKEKNRAGSTNRPLTVLLSLSPPSLGPVQACLTLRENQLVVTINVSAEKSRTILNSLLPGLREKLTRTGLKVSLPPVRLTSTISLSGNGKGEWQSPGIDLKI